MHNHEEKREREGRGGIERLDYCGLKIVRDLWKFLTLSCEEIMSVS